MRAGNASQVSHLVNAIASAKSDNEREDLFDEYLDIHVHEDDVDVYVSNLKDLVHSQFAHRIDHALESFFKLLENSNVQIRMSVQKQLHELVKVLDKQTKISEKVTTTIIDVFFQLLQTDNDVERQHIENILFNISQLNPPRFVESMFSAFLYAEKNSQRRSKVIEYISTQSPTLATRNERYSREFLLHVKYALRDARMGEWERLVVAIDQLHHKLSASNRINLSVDQVIDILMFPFTKENCSSFTLDEYFEDYVLEKFLSSFIIGSAVLRDGRVGVADSMLDFIAEHYLPYLDTRVIRQYRGPLIKAIIEVRIKISSSAAARALPAVRDALLKFCPDETSTDCSFSMLEDLLYLTHELGSLSGKPESILFPDRTSIEIFQRKMRTARQYVNGVNHAMPSPRNFHDCIKNTLLSLKHFLEADRPVFVPGGMLSWRAKGVRERLRKLAGDARQQSIEDANALRASLIKKSEESRVAAEAKRVLIDSNSNSSGSSNRSGHSTSPHQVGFGNKRRIPDEFHNTGTEPSPKRPHYNSDHPNNSHSDGNTNRDRPHQNNNPGSSSSNNNDDDFDRRDRPFNNRNNNNNNRRNNDNFNENDNNNYNRHNNNNNNNNNRFRNRDNDVPGDLNQEPRNNNYNNNSNSYRRNYNNNESDNTIRHDRFSDSDKRNINVSEPQRAVQESPRMQEIVYAPDNVSYATPNRPPSAYRNTDTPTHFTPARSTPARNSPMPTTPVQSSTPRAAHTPRGSSPPPLVVSRTPSKESIHNREGLTNMHQRTHESTPPTTATTTTNTPPVNQYRSPQISAPAPAPASAPAPVSAPVFEPILPPPGVANKSKPNKGPNNNNNHNHNHNNQHSNHPGNNNNNNRGKKRFNNNNNVNRR